MEAASSEEDVEGLGVGARHVDDGGALLATAWQVLARGGERAPACCKWDASRGPPDSCRCDVSQEIERNKVCSDVAPSSQEEEVGVMQPKVPQIIAEYDGGGSDAYAALRRMERYDPVRKQRGGELHCLGRCPPEG